jgi:hypothetical protein
LSLQKPKKWGLSPITAPFYFQEHSTLIVQ